VIIGNDSKKPQTNTFSSKTVGAQGRFAGITLLRQRCAVFLFFFDARARKIRRGRAKDYFEIIFGWGLGTSLNSHCGRSSRCVPVVATLFLGRLLVGAKAICEESYETGAGFAKVGHQDRSQRLRIGTKARTVRIWSLILCRRIGPLLSASGSFRGDFCHGQLLFAGRRQQRQGWSPRTAKGRGRSVYWHIFLGPGEGPSETFSRHLIVTNGKSHIRAGLHYLYGTPILFGWLFGHFGPLIYAVSSLRAGLRNFREPDTQTLWDRVGKERRKGAFHHREIRQQIVATIKDVLKAFHAFCCVRRAGSVTLSLNRVSTMFSEKEAAAWMNGCCGRPIGGPDFGLWPLHSAVNFRAGAEESAAYRA